MIAISEAEVGFLPLLQSVQPPTQADRQVSGVAEIVYRVGHDMAVLLVNRPPMNSMMVKTRFSAKARPMRPPPPWS